MVRTLEGKHPLYYEAILQLRDVLPTVIEFVQEDISKYRIPVPQIKTVKNGFDYYIADGKYTKALGKRLQQKFGGKQVVTASLVTNKDGKDLYRVTVLFRGVDFSRGDVVDYQGEEFKVMAMSKDILLKHSQTGKKVHLKYTGVGKIRKV